jgi:glycolate oxidase iron-sulfur subunit
MRELLETPDSVSADTGFHIDRCLGCLACTTTCPSGVDYHHLIEIGRERLDTQVRRPFMDRMMRRLLAHVIPHASRFRLMIRLGLIGKLGAPVMPRRIRAALAKLPRNLPGFDRIGSKTERFDPPMTPTRHVILLAGCAQRALDPAINASTVRVLNKLGVRVTVRAEAFCCGALAHHIGEADAARAAIRSTLLAWRDEIQNGAVDAIVVNASGCGTMVKDYEHVVGDDPELKDIAAQVASLTCDISELLADLPLHRIIEPAPEGRGAVAYHSACSLQHGQKIHDLPVSLLRQAGFDVRQPLEPHLCCGSAGVYNILQPDMAAVLRDRKLANIRGTGAPIVAAGNIGCIQQLDDEIPVRHTIQFIDYASGGPPPA